MPNGSTQPLDMKVLQEVEALVEISWIDVKVRSAALMCMSLEVIQGGLEWMKVLSAVELDDVGDTEPWRGHSMRQTRLPRKA